MNYKHTSASRYRISLSPDEKAVLRLALATLQSHVSNSPLPDEIINHTKTVRRKIYKTVEKVLLGEPIGAKQKEVLVATLHYGKTLVG